MKIPNKIKNKIRENETFLFHTERVSLADKRNGLYYLLLPILRFLKPSLLDLGLEDQETHSELYVLSCDLLSGYNKQKGSFIPYLETQLPWYASKHLKRIRKRETISGPIVELPGTYCIQEEFYWSSNLLLEERYVGKCFTRSEKYLIYIILMSDEDQLTAKQLALKCGIDRRTMKGFLNQIREVFYTEENNEQ